LIPRLDGEYAEQEGRLGDPALGHESVPCWYASRR